ncbi:sodium/potassium/calcium exchanger 1 [Tachyglossus aculeatus]|uniref:sodium/potassium/calcium exchanger 1 n=1 Tax=Tachyglossus aculeatus TaxID=9261 RepID=UPI0018F40E2B|nr:sodium/potassium/calcium exchanger 1 [Tachyglossus aculeatus]
MEAPMELGGRERRPSGRRRLRWGRVLFLSVLVLLVSTHRLLWSPWAPASAAGDTWARRPVRRAGGDPSRGEILGPGNEPQSDPVVTPGATAGKATRTPPRGTGKDHPMARSERPARTSPPTVSETKAGDDTPAPRNPAGPGETPEGTEPSPTLPPVAAETPARAPAATLGPGVPGVKTGHCVFVEPAPGGSTARPGPSPEAAAPGPPPAPGPGRPRPHPKAEYPEDVFGVEERRRGWVLLHVSGMMYVFVALAVVCDEYFVPALGVITSKLEISEDVAGATFMAAGGSAPELFTSLIGVFVSHSNVGIGTIVGSAVFNLLFVVGTCALFSREILHLTWWPLFRDVSFYILDLLMLIAFFLDSVMAWWESLALLAAYVLYVFAMKWNRPLEAWVKGQVGRRMAAASVTAGGDAPQLPSLLFQGSSSASLHNSMLRSTIFQLMIHTLDPLGEAHVRDKAEILSGLAKGQTDTEVKKGRKPPVASSQEPADTLSSDPQSQQDLEETPGHREPGDGDTEPPEGEDATGQDQCPGDGGDGGGDDGSEEDDDEDDDDEEDDDEEEENEKPLSLEWPETRRKQAIYLFLLPIVFPLWLTVPDVRRPESKKFFALTFLGSIMWIAMFSYLVVWWAHQVGETIGISEEIMGLTILAAGTSIPDLITSVIVARKGLGDMAVSSSVGSNIFDITVGLPVPWLLYSVFNGLRPVPVSSNGLFCAIVLLFLMLLFVITSIASCKWKMNKLLGFTMFILYFVFLLISVMLEDRLISCPISV